MIQWFVDKNNKIPLYLQLKDLIKYYISTGAIESDHQLPPVNTLAKELEVNFETVRKAYKELEREGLLSMKRGQGTHITLHNTLMPTKTPVVKSDYRLLEVTKSNIKEYLQNGLSLEEIRRILEQAFEEVSSEDTAKKIIFTECNTLQVEEISELLKGYLEYPINPVLLKDLPDALKNITLSANQPIIIITTGFHVNEVQEATKSMPVDIHILITHMSLETRRKLDDFSRSASFGFICRDQESILLYKDVLKIELDNPELDLTCAILGEESKVESILKSVDVLLVSPPVYEEIKSIAPPNLPIFNVFDRVDPMALKLIKDSIFVGDGQAEVRIANLKYSG